MAILRTLLENPRYALVRGIGRFASVRSGVTGFKRAITRVHTQRVASNLEACMDTTLLSGVDRHAFMREMHVRGCAFGMVLPALLVDAILHYADTHPVYAFRNEKYGFMPGERPAAEAALGKEILLAQYFNTERDCAAIRQLAADPLLNWVALQYLGTVPRFVGCNLWWTYPIRPSREDQLEHAHFFHRDIDDFKFIKFFFYLTAVEPGDGGHWLVAGSHRKHPHVTLKDRFVTRRFEDAEIKDFYAPSDILEVAGPRGLGFAEDTLCVHKAASPSRKPRLVLQLQFALFDLQIGNDRRASGDLEMLGTAAA